MFTDTNFIRKIVVTVVTEVVCICNFVTDPRKFTDHVTNSERLVITSTSTIREYYNDENTEHTCIVLIISNLGMSVSNQLDPDSDRRHSIKLR